MEKHITIPKLKRPGAPDYSERKKLLKTSDNLIQEPNTEKTILDNILNKINPKKIRTIDQEYLEDLLMALDKPESDDNIEKVYKKNKIAFEENVLTLYLLLKYEKNDLFNDIKNQMISNTQYSQEKIFTYLANICCRMNDSDNFQKLTSYKNYININSTMIHGININMQPCLKLAIQHTNIDLINKILHYYGNSINILAARGGDDVYQALLKNNDLQKTLEGLLIIQRIQEKYIEKILAKYPNPEDNQIESIAIKVKKMGHKSIIDDETIRNIESEKIQENNIVKPTNKRAKKQYNTKYPLFNIKSDLKNHDLKNILNKINSKKTKTIDKEYLEGLLRALDKPESDDNIKNLYKTPFEKNFEENVLTLYLLLEYGRDDLFNDIYQMISKTQYSPKKVFTYLANICCQINDLDNFKKITSNFKDFININSIKISLTKISSTKISYIDIDIDIQPSLKLAIQYTNIDMINQIFTNYGDSIDIFAARGNSEHNVYNALLNNKDLRKTLEGLLIIQKIQEKYKEQILAKYPNPEDNQIESIAQEIKEMLSISIINDDTAMDIEENDPTTDDDITKNTSSNLDILLKAIDLPTNQTPEYQVSNLDILLKALIQEQNNIDQTKQDLKISGEIQPEDMDL